MIPRDPLEIGNNGPRMIWGRWSSALMLSAGLYWGGRCWGSLTRGMKVHTPSRRISILGPADARRSISVMLICYQVRCLIGHLDDDRPLSLGKSKPQRRCQHELSSLGNKTLGTKNPYVEWHINPLLSPLVEFKAGVPFGRD